MYLLWAFSLFLLIGGLVGCSAWNGNRTHSTPPASTALATKHTIIVSTATLAEPRVTVTAAQTPEQLADRFYHAIEVQNVALAYTYLDPKATDADGSVLTLSSFEQLAQEEDTTSGKVTAFSASWYPPMLVMTIMRTQVGSYHAHLQLRKEGPGWKIVALDRI
jgi:hypothetical protein